jgi:hypothetical protein
MDVNGTQISKELFFAFIGLVLFSIGYNFLVEYFQKRTQRFTAEFVVGGVLITVMVSGLFIGWNNVAIVLLLFIGSGVPMLIGSWIRSARDDEEAKKVTRGTLK